MTGTAEFNSSTLYRYAHALSPDSSMCDITKLRSVGTAAG
ncbi:type I-E CRISPR-associated protein Cas7/Cse4/CasC [Streptomyces ipomoeae]|nr:type I-E CRISPR-associated protein Cas7/Cse4/CasC [Streptomyces ipomoeae]MDX2936792.1 type I-E CRISPR-associated protein Cas7/Cse4/CasC [Streptomyces ipomoeae]